MRFKFIFKGKSLRGFTLIEVLVYIGVLLIIVSALSYFMIWSIRSAAKIKTMREVSYNARRAIETMTHGIREAENVSTSSTAASLFLEKTDGTIIDFYLASSTLYHKEGLQNPFALTSDHVEVKNLEFLQVGSTTPSVRITLRIDYKNPLNLPQYQSWINVTSTASLRHY
jgi:type II secretory pathway pseudopilin PulG